MKAKVDCVVYRQRQRNKPSTKRELFLVLPLFADLRVEDLVIMEKYFTMQETTGKRNIDVIRNIVFTYFFKEVLPHLPKVKSALELWWSYQKKRQVLIQRNRDRELQERCNLEMRRAEGSSKAPPPPLAAAPLIYGLAAVKVVVGLWWMYQQERQNNPEG